MASATVEKIVLPHGCRGDSLFVHFHLEESIGLDWAASFSMCCAFTLEVTAGFSRMFFSYSSGASSPLQANAVSEPPAEKETSSPTPIWLVSLSNYKSKCQAIILSCSKSKFPLKPTCQPRHLNTCKDVGAVWEQFAQNLKNLQNHRMSLQLSSFWSSNDQPPGNKLGIVRSKAWKENLWQSRGGFITIKAHAPFSSQENTWSRWKVISM